MKIDRLVGIIMTLLDKKRIGARELAEMFEVSPRTIYRDIDAINMAGVPVRSVPGVGGGFEIMPAYKVDKAVFSADELAALLTGLSGLSGVARGDDLAGVLAKIRHFIPADKAKDIALKADQIRIEVSPQPGSPNIQPYLRMIKDALEDHRLLSFTYIAHHGNTTARTAEPYQLVLKDGRWYFYGYCRGRKDYRLFRLSRMLDLQMEEETFAPRDFQRPVLDFEEIVEAMRTEIRLRVHRSVLDRVLAFCSYDHFSPDGGEHYIVRFPFVENAYYYDILLGFGDKCECLGPPRVREELKRRIRDMMAVYQE